jgi:transaldolase
MAKEGKQDVTKVIKEICDLVKGPVSIEVVSQIAEGMFEEAKELYPLSEHIVVKIPAIPEGFKALNMIREYNKLSGGKPIKTNFTLLYTMNQALLAAKLGATYVSPFCGRLDVNTVEGAGITLIKEIRQLYDRNHYDTKILAASMRTASLVREAALAGADVATIPVSALEDMINNELSTNALVGFLLQWDKAGYEGKTMLGKTIYERKRNEIGEDLDIA